jgi:hypothetical protein
VKLLRRVALVASVLALVFASASAQAASFFFSTGDPDGLMAMDSRSASPGLIQVETADDFVLTQETVIDHATFTGLVPLGATVESVGLEIYRVFPLDSTNPPSGSVPTRTNSPADVAFVERQGSDLSFLTTDLQADFTVVNSVVNGISPAPNPTTGGEGPVTGLELSISVSLNDPLDLAPDHYFFVPQVQLDDGSFLWLSAPKPIVPPGTSFTPDLQTWIRSETLAPDWLRVGTDVVGGSPSPSFNASFSLSGREISATAIPEPAAALVFAAGLASVAAARRRE